MARQKRQPGDEPIAPPTLASGWDPCSWLNPGHIQCLRVGVVGSPKRWFCGWHYQVRRNPSIECFEEFERWLERQVVNLQRNGVIGRPGGKFPDPEAVVVKLARHLRFQDSVHRR